MYILGISASTMILLPCYLKNGKIIAAAQEEKLYYLRSDLSAITHVDFSARIQTVPAEISLRGNLRLPVHDKSRPGRTKKIGKKNLS